MLRATYRRYILKFNFRAITSRQSMTEKETFFVYITDTDYPGVIGVGECAIFRGLSMDDTPDYEQKLSHVCHNIDSLHLDQITESSIRFGLETAFNDLKNGGIYSIFKSQWQQGAVGIPINGLVWMGNFDEMLNRIEKIISEGFKCIKIKIGGIDFDKETQLLQYIRDTYDSNQLEIRLDANGSMLPHEALKKLDILSRYDIHSIEQPIRTGLWNLMKEITRYSPIDIALDEELIGTATYDDRCYMLDAILPQYIILKPSLHGGFNTCDHWIKDATDRDIKWWATSALESNIGLNAIAQWTASKNIELCQGLGTGTLYYNNITSPLYISDAKLYYDINGIWNGTL